MAHETPTLTAELRDRTGTRFAQRLRKQKRLPAVIYGHKTEPVPVSFDEKELLTAIHLGAHVMEITVAGKAAETCLVKDLQFGFLGDDVIHVDFARVDLDEEVTIQVHLAFVGVPAEARHAGAILEHDHTELSVRCRVRAIPEEIKVDLSTMEGHQLTAQEIPLPDGIALADEPNTMIASISFVKAVDDAGEEADVVADGAEPEIITEAKDDDAAGGDASKGDG